MPSEPAPSPTVAPREPPFEFTVPPFSTVSVPVSNSPTKKPLELVHVEPAPVTVAVPVPTVEPPI